MRGLETEMKVVRPGLCCLETNILIHLGLLKLLMLSFLRPLVAYGEKPRGARIGQREVVRAVPTLRL